MAKVRFDKLRKVFGRDVVAVAGLDFEIADGDFVSLVGPSGCGKSTALRMIAGLEEPSSGRLFFDDRDVTEREPRDRDIAMVFQSYALYPHMTVRGNLEYGLRKRRVPAEQRERRVTEIAHMLRIEPFLDRKPRQLSGGQRQRVALGRALIRDPEVFLLDEPLSNLDAKLRVHMRAELATLHQQVRTTMIYVTHDQLEAMTLSDRIVVMNHGLVQQIGSPEDVYKRPANRFVAEFIGTPAMNLIEGRVVANGAGMIFEAGGLQIALPGGVATEVREDRVLLGFRPEDIVITSATAGPDTIESRVAVAELAGAEKFLYMEIAGTKIVARVAADTPVRAGDTLQVRLPQDRLHVFDGIGDDAPAVRMLSPSK